MSNRGVASIPLGGASRALNRAVRNELAFYAENAVRICPILITVTVFTPNGGPQLRSWVDVSPRLGRGETRIGVHRLCKNSKPRPVP